MEVRSQPNPFLLLTALRKSPAKNLRQTPKKDQHRRMEWGRNARKNHRQPTPR